MEQNNYIAITVNPTRIYQAARDFSLSRCINQPLYQHVESGYFDMY